jgi:hypothetical protein
MKVAASALTVLDEVCDDKMYLESLVATKSTLFSPPGREALDRLGDRGRLLLTRRDHGSPLETENCATPSQLSSEN